MVDQVDGWRRVAQELEQCTMFRRTQFAGERERIANALHFGARVQPALGHGFFDASLVLGGFGAQDGLGLLNRCSFQVGGFHVYNGSRDGGYCIVRLRIPGRRIGVFSGGVVRWAHGAI